ncbi:hypothetical protein AAFF_G00349780 [Aldrovandia affinis]|uniref:Uncharacterized protein n=1 Tax=Aldrovandia affinis TaxID=143900 RepID=A0AAD7SJ95_9TELE|nr:hypothetical protein AAFF_G00349780 [Aldrovandia affinis]
MGLCQAYQDLAGTGDKPHHEANSGGPSGSEDGPLAGSPGADHISTAADSCSTNRGGRSAEKRLGAARFKTPETNKKITSQFNLLTQRFCISKQVPQTLLGCSARCLQMLLPLSLADETPLSSY